MRVLRQLALEWAVVPLAGERAENVEDTWAAIAQEVELRGLARAGDTMVITGRADQTTHVSVHRFEGR